MSEPALRLVPPLEPPAPRALRAVPTETPDDLPPLDWSGTLRMRKPWQEVSWEVFGILAGGVVGAVAWLITGDEWVMGGAGGGVALLMMIVDRRVTRAHRWSTTARPPAGARRRTDAERRRAMAETAAAAGVVHRG